MTRSLPTIALLLCSSPAAAICALTPFDQQLAAADSVFIATVTRAEIQQPSALTDGAPFRINYSFVVRERLKGDPARTWRLYVVKDYDDPTDQLTWEAAEDTRLVPGDSVLVVARGTGDVQVGSCTPSQPVFGTELVKRARSALAR